MNQNTCIEELLNGLNMGMLAIDHLIDKISDEKLRDLVLHQRKHYGDLKNKVLEDYPHSEDMTKNKLMLESMIEMKTLVADDCKIAKMLMQGSLQSVITMTHLINKEVNTDHKVKEYANQFEDISKKYMDDLKPYL